MAIEDLKKVDMNNKLAIQGKGIEANNIVLAGLIVRHKLLPHRYIIEGFIVEDYYFNQNDFKYNGQEIKYNCQDKDDPDCYSSRNSIIYAKLTVDGKNKEFSEYFRDEDKFTYRNSSEKDSPYLVVKVDDSWVVRKWSHNVSFDFGLKYEYYLYRATTSEIPECSANKVFALCKHYEDGGFKFSIFNLHELIPEMS